MAVDSSVFTTDPFVYVDYNVLNDPITSSAQTQRRSDFRDDVIKRDGERCIFTREEAEDCDASHIIPKSKGDEVLCNLSYAILK
jgi:hypothetical protein